MLELAATAWVYALAITTSLFLGVLVVQAVVRHVRSTARAVRQVVLDGQQSTPAREMASAGSRAA